MFDQTLAFPTLAATEVGRAFHALEQSRIVECGIDDGSGVRHVGCKGFCCQPITR